ncbi:MAG: aminopeptidase P family protein [Acidobacteriaceae bacterium]|jgi:Xaa-Pro aminopeptidase|nr:aminopeptidase P family protein [Acidobacteriaceae bacterium]
MTNLSAIQAALREENLDGWLFFDHHLRDPLAYRILNFDPPRTPSRRWYYLIPAHGEPRKLEHRIERNMLGALPGVTHVYSSWGTQVDGLATLLAGCRRVAMQYSPDCAIPYVAMVDAGTVELVRARGVEVASSANLVQYFEARWTQDKLDSHLAAGELVDQIRRRAFEEIGDRLRGRELVNEWLIAAFIRQAFERAGLYTDHGPIVAVNSNCSNPHYEPHPENSAPIEQGDVVLIDMWAKLARPGSVYYDITWTGYTDHEIPSNVQNIFSIVAGARDAAIAKVQSSIANGEPLYGYEVDDACRGHIREHGLAEYFVHRTGHSIGEEVHGSGANMDNLETHDERRVIPWTCFSVEPGIYLPEFGIRSEVNLFIGDTAARVTGEKQEKMLLI